MAKITKIFFGAKCSDMATVDFHLSDSSYRTGTGYAPYIRNVCMGDYFEFEVDNDTGKILNWTPINVEDIDYLLEQM